MSEPRRLLPNERGHYEKDYGSVQQHTPADCPKCNQVTIGDLEAENARLQARVDNQEPWLAALGRLLAQHRIVRFPDDVLAWRDERDRHKALAERRGEALRKALPALRHYGRPHEQGNLDCPRCPADAAIAARIDQLLNLRYHKP